MIKLEVEGTGALISELKMRPIQTRLALIAALYGACQLLRNAAVNGIRKGPKTGRLYKKAKVGMVSATAKGASRSRKGGVFHRASAQGEYPAADTGGLMQSIGTEVNEGTLVGEVGTNLLYGKVLEFKDPARGGRPWLSRAWAEVQAAVEAAFLAALQKVFPGDQTVTRL